MSLYVMASMQACQVILVTLVKEMKDGIPFATEISSISATGGVISAFAVLG